jgi:hypothetical protein
MLRIALRTALLVALSAAAPCLVTAQAPTPAPDAGQTLGTPVPPPPGKLRVLVYHDMEGLSGQSDPQTFMFAHKEKYAEGRERLVADVNAVVDGLVKGGATAVAPPPPAGKKYHGAN